MYKIKKNAGIKEKSPMFTLPSTKTRSGKNNVISKVHPTTKNAVRKNLNKVFFGSDFFSKILPSGSNGVSRMKIYMFKINIFFNISQQKRLYLVKICYIMTL